MDKESLLKNLTSEQADAMVEMMHVKLGPELSGAIDNTPFSQNHYFRFMYLSLVMSIHNRAS